MNFDRVAGLYPWMENLLAGPLMQRCRTAQLPHCRDRKRAVLVGEGTGRFLVELLRTNPTVEVTCIEQSSRMLQQIQARFARHHLFHRRIEWINGDVLCWIPPVESFDLICTHFFLDCFTAFELSQVIGKLSSAATPDALWLVSDFQIPPAGVPRWRARLIVAALYQFFRRTTGLSADELISPDSLLAAHQFHLEKRTDFSLGLTHSDLWRKAFNECD